jgi:UPF0755 protein
MTATESEHVSPGSSSRRLRYGIFAVVLPVVVVGLWTFFGPISYDGGVRKILYVSKGQSFETILDSLESQGVISSRLGFDLVARTYGGTSTLKVGKYGFASGVSNSEIFLSLRSGKGNMLISVPVPEGYLSRTQARLFARILGIDSTRYSALVHDPDFAGSCGLDRASLEGYLLPQTYDFTWQQDERDIIRTQVHGLLRFFDDSLRARASEMRMTMHEVLTLASIVEGEAMIDEERPVIAGVYLNRLRKGMKLEADPTIQFTIPDGPRRVFYSDLKRDSPYNTYRYRGLPPGPVNNPGTSSILAVLHPARHAYLFFVANGHGGHWFSSSYSEHLKYVRKYRRDRAKGFALK